MKSSAPAPRRPGRLQSVEGIDPYAPTVARPVRVRSRTIAADTHFEPHRHPWAQVAYCSSGIVQVTVQGPQQITRIVPPSRAVWVPPGAMHAVAVIEAAEFRTVYVDASAAPAGWTGSRVLMVSPLLRELVHALDAPPPEKGSARELHLMRLVLDEMAQASTQSLGVPMPPAQGDKRLRALCEAVVHAPGRRASLAAWVADVGASERTIARLFQRELGLPYQQWHQQVILAHALPMLARGAPVGQVAAATGYASDSAFTAMFKAAMGQSPSHFQNKAGAAG